MSENSELGFKLENTEYDWLIIGTGVEESMYAAHLAKVARQKVLHILSKIIISCSC